MTRFMQKVLRRISKKNKQEQDYIISSSEHLDRMREVQKSIKMQVISFFALLFISLLFLGVLGHFYKSISYQTEVNRLQKQVVTNTSFLAQNFDVNLLVDALKNYDKITAEKIYQKVNLYAILLDAEYVYVMLLENNITDDFINFTPVANIDVRGSVLAKSEYPMRLVLLNGYPEAMFDSSYWDDVNDYTKPGPLEAMIEGKVNVSEPILSHPRWGNLISGQAPLYYEGELIGFLGVDYNLDIVAGKISKSWMDLSISLMLVALILICIRTILMAHVNYITLKKIVHQKYTTSGAFVLTMSPKEGEDNDEENH